MVYTHVTAELQPGESEEFAKTMARIVNIVTQDCGWELREALYQIDGRLETARHIWKLRDLNHYMEGSQYLMSHSDFPELSSRLSRHIAQETICFAVDAPYARQRQL